jgi:hypothetical protein
VPDVGDVVWFGGRPIPDVADVVRHPGLVLWSDERGKPEADLTIAVLYEDMIETKRHVPYAAEPRPGHWTWPDRRRSAPTGV